MQHVTQAQVLAVESVGMTVSDMDIAVTFYSEVLSFEKVSDREVWGTEYEHLQGIFGVRMRIVRMKLGDEELELTEYLTPKGRPIPVDSRSNDFQLMLRKSKIYQTIVLVTRNGNYPLSCQEQPFHGFLVHFSQG